MLYEPKRHEPLVQIPWSERIARDVISEITAETHERHDPKQFCQCNLRDDATEVLKGLWFGAAGIIWALYYLRECGAADSTLDCADAIARVHARFLEEGDPKVYSGSFQLPHDGFLLRIAQNGN